MTTRVDVGDRRQLWNAIRQHPITTETCWLVGVAGVLLVELTGALEREERLHDRIAELELRQAATIDGKELEGRLR